MAIDSSAPRSRRAILGAALGGAGALFASALGRAAPVAAADGDPVLLGKGTGAGENIAATETRINTSAANGLTVFGGATNGIWSKGDGTTLFGESTQAAGALGTSGTWAGVVGQNKTPGGDRSTGVLGYTGDGVDLPTSTAFTGVYGFSEDPDNNIATGVWGDSFTGVGAFGTGFYGTYGIGAIGAIGGVDDDIAGPGSAGVAGYSSSAYTGVYGFAGDTVDPGPAAKSGVTGRAGGGASYGVVAASSASSQYALYVAGRLKMTTSAGARTTIASTATSKKVTLTGITTSSFVIATLQSSVSGCYVRNVVCSTGYFTIYLSKAPGKTVAVGYVVVN